MNEEENLSREVKRKREFSELPNSLIEKALEAKKGDVKETRAFLRKYFGVFLTNKVLKLEDEEILKRHVSSKERNYSDIYGRILSGNERTVIDLGAGVNGFSFPFIKKKSQEARYIGIEATGQLARKMQKYFEKNKFDAEAVCLDLFESEEVMKIIRKENKQRAIFLFNVIDALESFEWNYSKKLLTAIKREMGEEDRIIISFPTQSLSGKRKFFAKRDWLIDFLKENFVLIDDFEFSGEKFLVVGKMR